MMWILQGILLGIFSVCMLIGLGIFVVIAFKINKAFGIGTALLIFSYIGYSTIKILGF